ncbi:MAG TPA: hypothetical protein VK473_03780 [Terriglobales bacterium]|nr:hypothetical protein [Terriglobales bacterium]
MSLTLVIAVLALGAVLFLYYLARGQSALVSNLDDLGGRTHRVDVEALRNLIDPEQELYLRTKLTPGDFRRLQRQRAWASIEYVGRIAHNAAVLLRLGEAARKNPDPRIAAAAQDIVDSALRVRIFALLALTRLFAQVALPGTATSASDIFQKYQQLTYAAGLLARLQRPAYAGRLTALL